MDILVSTEWLAGELGASDLRIVDASYFALDPGRNPEADYDTGHIPGAIFLNLAELKDSNNPVPFMLPPAEKFASRMQALGIGDRNRVVLYDNTPHITAARAWWMFRTFGAHDVAVLDGGLAKWVAEGRPLETGKPALRHRHFTARADPKAVRTLDQMKANVISGAEQVLDARGVARFTGEEADPRREVVPGHIPGSKNLPYDRLFNPDRTWKRGEALKTAFEDAGIDLSRPLVTTCGSGVTASILLFGAALLGKTDTALYDGSWSEWGTDPSNPRATGAA